MIIVSSKNFNLKILSDTMETSTLFRLSDYIVYADDAVVSKTIIKKETGTVTLFAFGKGQGLSPHIAPFDALVQIVDGECIFMIGDVKNSMQTGDCIILPAGIVHAVESVTPFKMLLTMIKIPKAE
jgi:quercetin dioxygenase-like cupin family protein